MNEPQTAPVNFAVLLVKYIQHVLDHEGTDYLRDYHRVPVGATGPEFTDAEWSVLQTLSLGAK